MDEPSILILIASVAIQAGFWAAVAFPVVTGFIWPWWRHQWGWTVVSMDTSIALALLTSVMYFEFGLKLGSTPYHVLAWVETVALCLIPLIIIWRGVLTYLTQRHGNRQDLPVEPVSVALEAASVFTFWVAFAFPLAVSLFWPWWQSSWGKNIVLLEGCIWVSLLPAPLHAIFGVPYTTFLLWFQVAAVFASGLTVAWRGILIYLTQRAGRRPPAD